MQKLIGRHKEIKRLKEYEKSTKSEFIVVYGRRRVGKTFLIRQTFEKKFTFYTTGIANVGEKQQLIQFHAELTKYNKIGIEITPAQDWFAAFGNLIKIIESYNSPENKVIFFDELPWLAKGSKFISALEYFWNSWASTRDDILLIGCGSTASWMIDKIINNKGGLHNRITGRIKLEPFTLSEVEKLLKSNNINYDRYQIVLLYMAFGGIPYYLEQVKKGLSAMQNINELCFYKNAPFRDEYINLFKSLFKKSDLHTTIIEALASKNKGLNRSEIVKITAIANGGSLTRILTELEQSSFIRRYNYIGKKQRDSLYQLVDMYSLFYLKFIKESSVDDENYWTNSIESPKFHAWSGYSFEMVCLHHVDQIKTSLGIKGIQTSVASWHSDKAQIDLLIDRKDNVINLCEMKFSLYPYSINKTYAKNLRNKLGAFKDSTKTRKSLFLTMITTYGLSDNMYVGMIQNQLTMDDLFDD